MKAVNSALVGLAIAAVAIQNVSAHQPHLDALNRRGSGHLHALERKDSGHLMARQGLGDLITTGPSSDPPGNTITTPPGGPSTTDPPTRPPTTGPPTTTDPPTTDPPTTEPTTTSDPTSTTQTTTSNTSTSNTAVTTSGTTSRPQGTTIARQNTGTSFARTGNTSNLRASTSSREPTASAASNDDDTPFMQNKAAVAATFTVVSIVGLGIIVFIVIWLRKKSQREKMLEEDMWDEAGMKEFTRSPPDASITTPSPVVLGSGGLGRSNTVLPSQSVGAGRHPRSSPDGYGDEPDEILAMPPVSNYERPRDSAFDIVPAPPPAAGYGGPLQPPRRGDHTSFGSGLGMDPFAGSGFVDATRESPYGSGQAGRGAGYNMGPYDQQPHSGGSGNSGVNMGNQWPQGYNPYTGYSQGGEEAYGNYGAQGYAR